MFQTRIPFDADRVRVLEASFGQCQQEALVKGATPAQAEMLMPTILPDDIRDPGQPLLITCKNTPVKGRDALLKKNARNEKAVDAMRNDLKQAHAFMDRLATTIQHVAQHPAEYPSITPEGLARIQEDVETAVLVIARYALLLAKCTAKQGEDGHYCTFNAYQFEAVAEARAGRSVKAALESLEGVHAALTRAHTRPSLAFRAMSAVRAGVRVMVDIAVGLVQFIVHSLWTIRRNLFIAGVAIAVPYVGAAFLYHFKYLETMHGVYSFWSTLNTIGEPLCRVYHSSIPFIMTGLLVFDIVVADAPLSDALDTLIKGTMSGVLHGVSVGAKLLETAIGGASAITLGGPMGAVGTAYNVAGAGGAFDLRSMTRSVRAVEGTKPSAALNRLSHGMIEWVDKLLRWKGAPPGIRDIFTHVFAPVVGRGTLAVTVQWMMMKVVTPVLYRILQWTCTMTRGKTMLAEGAGRLGATAIDVGEALQHGTVMSSAIGWINKNLANPIMTYLQDAVAWGSDTARRLGPEAAAYKARQMDLADLTKLAHSNPIQALIKSIDTKYADVLRRYVNDATAAWIAAARPAVPYKPTRRGAARDFAELYAAVHAPPEVEEEGGEAGWFDMAGLMGKRVVHVELKKISALEQARGAGYITHTRVDQVTYLECAVMYFWMVHGVSYPRTMAMLLLLVCGVLLMALLLYYFRKETPPEDASRAIPDLLSLFDIDTAEAEGVLGASLITLLKTFTDGKVVKGLEEAVARLAAATGGQG